MRMRSTWFSDDFQAIRAVGPFSHLSSLTGSPSPSLGREVQLSARPGFFRPLRASLPHLAGLFRPAGIHGIFPSEVCSRPEPDTFRLALPFFPFPSRPLFWTGIQIRFRGSPASGAARSSRREGTLLADCIFLSKGFQTLRPGFQSFHSGGQLTRQIRHVPARGSASVALHSRSWSTALRWTGFACRSRWSRTDCRGPEAEAPCVMTFQPPGSCLPFDGESGPKPAGWAIAVPPGLAGLFRRADQTSRRPMPDAGPFEEDPTMQSACAGADSSRCLSVTPSRPVRRLEDPESLPGPLHRTPSEELKPRSAPSRCVVLVRSKVLFAECLQADRVRQSPRSTPTTARGDGQGRSGSGESSVVVTST